MTASALWDRLLLKAAHIPQANQTIPAFLYGTAWKKERSADLVNQALCAGFTGIDTAAQPKHYREDLVGDGLRKALLEEKLKREDIYVQTKFTSLTGQDPQNMPYDPGATIPEQVRTSIESSLHNLRHSGSPPEPDDTYIDTLVLHSPLPTMDETMQAWNTAEGFVPHKIRNLGISNCPLSTLVELHEKARIKPAVVQNRFYAKAKFDIAVRKFCRDHGIIYQSFWTLTANPRLVWSAEVGLLGHQVGISPQEALYCLVLGLGNTVILNGTKSGDHMKSDLKAPGLVKAFAEKYPEHWEGMLEGFKKLIGENGAA